MKAPKRVTENRNIMPVELIKEAKKVKDVLFDLSIDDKTANSIIDDFNTRWISSGGISSSCIIGRHNK